MGIAERKSREKEELRVRIIEAAAELFREAGYAAVSMRQIAKRVEYSVGTLYLHYKDKDELFLAVQQAAFLRAFAYMEPALREPTPWEKIVELGRRYLEFATDNPDLYRLMFMMENPMEAIAETESWKSGMRLHELLATIVQECMEAGEMDAGDVGEVSFTIWSMVHGMASLYIARRTEMYGEDQLQGKTCLTNDVAGILRAYEKSVLYFRKR